ncbi:E3 ubiquitin protein ligase RIN2-like [Impatiens glandulifera]|uniref:E3 ubiquitin protein ligase RIN2-like n=1 Tax=Impatiens glandulifera TaxID=253017 RepID=UPI001FB0A564|nr:E3 ubiquitin protein ligase RIN2-like [Impatiens glandulifera]
MGVRYLSFSAGSTLLSFVGLHYWITQLLQNLISDGLIRDESFDPRNIHHALELLLGSSTTIVLLANFGVNAFILLVLSLKEVFFMELYPSESRKLMERLVNYVIYKGTFLPLVVPPTKFQAGVWSSWLLVLCSLKMFQALARDRLERLNASPSASPRTYFRVYSVLLFVLSVDLIWIQVCLAIGRTLDPSVVLLLFFEPLSIAFETLQAIVVHGFQLLDIWVYDSAGDTKNCQISKLKSAAGLWEWKGNIIRNLGFLLDIMTLLMALGHYVHIWWLHGMSFHLVDAVLFLNIRALLSAIAKRIKGFVRLRMALGTLHGALPDATHNEIQAYNDECAICREPMAKAKKLSCNHLFHLLCLRSWLDQCTNENYPCPTCRKPLFQGRTEDELSPHAADVSNDEQLARQISSGLDQHTPAQISAGVFSNPTQNPLETSPWSGAGLEPSWLHGWSGQGVDGAGPSTRPAGLGRVQMMMRQLAAVGETYAQTTLEDTAWNLWPINNNTSQVGASTSSSIPPPPPPGSARHLHHRSSGLHIRTASLSNDHTANILAMAETVREVLPHVPEQLIFEDLQRTNSVTVTVNNLLQM